MKLHSLISAVMLGMAVLVQAQTSPAPQAPQPALKLTGAGGTGAAQTKPALNANDAGFEKYKTALNGDGSMTILAGTLGEMVNEIHWRVGRTGYWPQVRDSGNMDMPNLIFGKGAREASVPGEVTLRGVTPVQALALVAAAAGCTFQPIFAPDEKADQERVIIGYRIALQAASGFGITGGDVSGMAGGGVTSMSGPKFGSSGSPFGSSGGSSGTSGSTSGLPRARPSVQAVDPNSTGTTLPGSSRIRVANNSVLGGQPVNLAGIPADISQPLTKIYTIGLLLDDKNKEAAALKIQSILELIELALNKAEISDPRPLNGFHEKTGALILKATAAQHEIIEQAINALRENSTQPAGGKKP